MLPRDATNMGLRDMSSFSPTWLDADWRTLERDGE